MGYFETVLKIWVSNCLLLAAAVIVSLVAFFLVFFSLNRGAKKTGSIVDASLVAHARYPALLLLPLTSILLVLPTLDMPENLLDDMRHIVVLGMIAASAWLAISLTSVFDDYISSKFKIDVSDNLLARQVNTRTRVIRRIATIVIFIVAASAMLVTFPSIRNIGLSLFASAGVAGVIVGMAARPVLSNIIAGIQIAATQPVRIDDVVVLEGEWGKIEEIGSTHVVVRLWDLRHLVVPLSYFIEKPFQNWTYKTADILGSVFLYTDYNVPVEELRVEFYRLLQSSEMWDGNVWSLQVTNATERTMELRALMSAPDSETVWNLRCHIREKLVQFLQEHHPQSLPRVRAEVGERPQGQEEREREMKR